jgi:N-acetylglucosaminyldiphosphoundecaprenol N-acetyl-beta-D-mannosaminyltransferase
MRVPVDALPEDRLPEVVDTLVDRDSVSHMVLIRWWDFMRGRRDREFRACLKAADCVVPVSRSLVGAARLLRGVRPDRYMPFSFVIRVLGALETRSRSVYLLGGTPDALRTVEQNLRETFPGLRVVGRYTGYYPRRIEDDIITAIRKAHPDFVLLGPGTPGGERWVARHRDALGHGVFLYSSEVFDVFSDRRQRVSDASFRRGTDFVPGLFRRPWRALRFLVYLWFLLLLLLCRLFRR